VNHSNSNQHISGTADHLGCSQLRWAVNVVNWWPLLVYYTDHRHLCTARWARGTASQGVSAAAETCSCSLCCC